ncbi:hypothetical protein [Hyphococcus sp.]|jgi:hypothetical protein|uniref:hypothetical protein n=1 Tax=Hyphococcus sp. TaxID=2038636 RepID=UPI003D0DA77D
MTFQSSSKPQAFAPLSAESMAGGVYGWLTPYLIALAKQNAHIHSRLLHLTRTELHFIALCLALMGEKRDDADHFGAFARDYDRLPRRSLLANYIDTAGPGYSPKLATLVSKLAGRPWRMRSYLRLGELYAEPHARKTLCHLASISRWHLIALSRLPAPYRTYGVLRKIRKRYDLACVMFGIEVVRRVRTDMTDRQIIASLERSDTSRIRDWVEAHYERLPFPTAPTGALTDGTGAVSRPVATARDLFRAAREFDNCVDRYLWEALTGRSCFYRCDNGQRRIAVAELKRLPGVGWAVDEIRGPNNAELSGPERAQVFAMFREAGVLPAPQALSRFSWFDLE